MTWWIALTAEGHSLRVYGYCLVARSQHDLVRYVVQRQRTGYTYFSPSFRDSMKVAELDTAVFEKGPVLPVNRQILLMHPFHYRHAQAWNFRYYLPLEEMPKEEQEVLRTQGPQQYAQVPESMWDVLATEQQTYPNPRSDRDHVVRELRKLHRQDAGYMEPVPVRDFSRRIVRLKSVSKRGT